MTIRSLILILFLALSSTSYAGNTPSGASSLEQVGTWMGDQLGSYVSSGCLPTVPASSMTLAPLACRGAVRLSTGALRYVNQTAAPITLTGANGRFFLAIHSDQQTAVTGWTRTVGSHYLWQRFTGTNVQLPAAPANAQLVAEITVAGGVVTAVTDRRRPASLASSGVCELTDPLFGAVGNGTTDDTAALQAAASNYSCGTVTGKGGDQYRVTASLLISRAFRLTGTGAGPGGATTPDTRYQGMAINHDFNGNLFEIPGILNDVVGTVGFELDNMVLRQVYGTNTGAAGTAINILGTTTNFRATWVKVHNVNIEQGSAVDSWSWGVSINGEAVDVSSIGSRDHSFENMRIIAGPFSTGAVLLWTATHARFRDILLNVNSGTACDFVISGPDATHPTQLTHLTAVRGSCGLVVHHARNNMCYSCAFATFSASADTVGYDYLGSLSNPPTISSGSAAVYVYSNGVQYLAGDANRAYTFKAIDGNQTRVGIDTPAGVSGYMSFKENAVEQWQLGRNGADNSFSLCQPALVGPAGCKIYGVDQATGQWKHWFGTANNLRTLTFNSAIDSPLVVDATLANQFVIVVNGNGAFTIAAPTTPVEGQELKFILKTTFGGAVTGPTWDGVYHLQSAWVNAASGSNRSITFLINGGIAYEIARTTADVAN